MLTNDALTSLRSFLTAKFDHAAYVAEDTEYIAPIESAVLLEDGRIEISFILDPVMTGEITVTEVRLYDQNDILLASKAESITLDSVQESVMYRWVFTVTELS